MARPIELSLELAEGIANLVRAGNFPVRAAGAKGVPRSTWYSWLARGRKGAARWNDGSKAPKREAPFVALVHAIERAESESQVIAVNSLMKAMPTTSSAAIAWLERRFPSEWSRTARQQVEMSGPEGGPVAAVDTTMEFIEKARKLRERLLLSRAVIAIPQSRTGAIEPKRTTVDGRADGRTLGDTDGLPPTVSLSRPRSGKGPCSLCGSKGPSIAP